MSAHPLDQLRELALQEIAEANDEHALDMVRVRYLGKAGRISLWSEQMKTLTKEEKPVVGKLLSEVRTLVTEALEKRTTALQSEKEVQALAGVDISLPGSTGDIGSLH